MVTALLLTLTLGADPLFMPGAVEKERFKAYFTQGEQLYAQGEYGAAIWNFRRADRQLATPEVIYDLAKCYEKLGDTAFSTYYYRLYLKRAPNASDALDVAEKVGTALSKAEADGRGFLEVEVYAAEAITVANQKYPEGPVALFLPPGDYEVSGNFPEGVKKMVAQLRTGKTTNLVFEPVSPPLVDAIKGAPEGAMDLKGSASRGRPGLKATGLVVGGLGIAALATGTVLGLLASQDAARLTAKPPLMISEARALASAANTKGLAANVLWPTGGALLAGGVLMFVLSVALPEPGMSK